MRHGFQDETFEVDCIAGDSIVEVIGFSEDGPRYPQKLLFRFARAGWCACYLSAFIGHWDPSDEADVADVRDDYTGVSMIDYGDLWQLIGVRIDMIRCERREGVTAFTFVTEAGTLVLREVDGGDPHSASKLVWRPTG